MARQMITKWQAFLAEVDRTELEDELYELAFSQDSFSYFQRAHSKLCRVRKEREVIEWQEIHNYIVVLD